MHAWALLSSPLWNCMFPVNNIPCQTSQSISFSSLKHNKRMYYSLVSRNYAIIMYSLLSYFFRNWLTLVGGTSFYQPWWSWRSPLQCYHCLCKPASKIQGILRLRSDTQLSIDSMNYFLLYSSFTFYDQTDLLCCAVLYVFVQWIIYALKLTLIIIQLAPWLQETVIILLKMVKTHSFPRNQIHIYAHVHVYF